MAHFLFILVVCIAVSLPHSLRAEDPVPPIAESANEFAFDLYGELRSKPNAGNVFISPYSIYTALSMTYRGATGISKEEFEQLLHVDGAPKTFHSSMRELNSGLISPAFGSERYKFSISNAIWVNPRFELEQPYIDFLSEFYDAQAYNELSVPKINAWAEEKTGGKITNLLRDSDVDADTVTILTNAAYFLGYWQSQFEEENTEEQIFYGFETEENLPLMYQKLETKYYEEEGYQAVSLDYDGSDLAMAVILPKENTKQAFAAVEEQLNAGMLDTIMFKMGRQEVDIYLPKFELKYNSYLKSPLRKLGLKKSVTAEAEFCGIYSKCQEEPIWIKDVVHQAYIKVDEAGTEAAAATAVIMTTEVAAIQRIITFRADHPFIYFIYDQKSGVIIFLGRFLQGSE